MSQINDRLEFPTELDLSNYLSDVPEADRSKAPIYQLLSVRLHYFLLPVCRICSCAPLKLHSALRWECLNCFGMYASLSHHTQVLVHVGGIHGGHYYAFVRPSAASGGQWFKFDDETVMKVEEKEAVQDNWGGSHVGQYGQQAQKLNSAYMLTYVRADDIAEIMRPVRLALAYNSYE